MTDNELIEFAKTVLFDFSDIKKLHDNLPENKRTKSILGLCCKFCQDTGQKLIVLHNIEW